MRALPARLQALIVLALVIAAAGAAWVAKSHSNGKASDTDTALSSQSKRPHGLFYPTKEQWAALTVEPVEQRVFRSERVTEGKIAVDEDRATPIFSPYAGRVIKLFVKPGEVVKVGQPLFTVEATDMVQAQNDFITAATALNKARSALNLAEINDKRQRLLYEGATQRGAERQGRARRRRERRAFRRGGAGSSAQSAAHSRQDRSGDR
jgi:cobalt-zinc-cadmium efflux system membrane fusion protein